MIWQNVIVFDYYLHQDEIIAEKCENKKNPESHCHGACYVNKQLNQIEESTPRESSYQVNILDSWLITYHDVKEVQVNCCCKTKSLNFYKTRFDLQQIYLPAIYHPPQIS